MIENKTASEIMGYRNTIIIHKIKKTYNRKTSKNLFSDLKKESGR